MASGVMELDEGHGRLRRSFGAALQDSLEHLIPNTSFMGLRGLGVSGFRV